ncbi:MAG: hypothetical protein ACE5R4_13105 [Armatimonadota bacterium]
MRRACGWIGLAAVVLLAISYVVAAFHPPVRLLGPVALFFREPDARRFPSEPLIAPGPLTWGAPAWDTEELRYPYGHVPPYLPDEDDPIVPVPPLL